MQSLRQFGNALILAVLSSGLVLGSLSISLVEFAPQPTPVLLTEAALPSPVPLTATATPPPPLASPTSTNTPLPTDTLPPPPSCQIPANWFALTIQPGDTLAGIAARYQVSVSDLRSGNCLAIDSLVPGSVVYVPPLPTVTVMACVPGAVGWARNYTVQAGDTFYRIASNHYTNAALLKQVNCRTSDLVRAGELLWVPNVATRTPTPTLQPNANTFTPYPTEPLTETALPLTATPEPSDTPEPPTATTAPSATLEPTLTASPTPFP